MKDIYSLLNQVKNITEKANEISKLRGEDFNIFSLLGVETKENQTHSNFISELLNPNGSHGLGNVFQKHFLRLLDFEIEEELTVQTEVHIGDGRIDITLESASYFLAIENKIYAADQDRQIERYCKYAHEQKRQISHVFYLTLYGTEASEGSTYDIELSDEANKGYRLLSYRDDIVKWLAQCLKEASDKPILRETIKQYLVLVKKLTDQKMEAELLETILKNYEVAQKIHDNFRKARRGFGDQIRMKVIDSLNKNEFVKNNFVVKVGNPVDHKSVFMQIWINSKEEVGINCVFGIESFSGKGNNNGNLFIGIVDFTHNPKIAEAFTNKNYMNKWWIHYYEFTTFENYTINFSSSDFLKAIVGNPHKQSELVKHIVNECVIFLKDNLKTYLKAVKASDINP